MKKVIIILIIVISFFTSTGCNKKDNKINEKVSDEKVLNIKVNINNKTYNLSLENNNTVKVITPITDINAKEAITHLRVLERYEKSTLIECILETGRTHQIRVHLNYIGHPIINDPVYGYKRLDDIEFGQMLHAKTIGFIHPITKEYLEFTSNPPKRFEEILDNYKNIN